MLDLCIRAFDYLPPVDVTFGDFLRALVTADTELNPDDPFDLRANLVDAFLNRGIHPKGVFSLNEESLLWAQPDDSLRGEQLDEELLASITGYEAQRWGSVRSQAKARTRATDVAIQLHNYATQFHGVLGLEAHSDACPIAVDGFHTTFHVGDDGQLLTEAVVQFTQQPKGKLAELGGLQPRAGTTVVFSGDGTPRYIISKPLRQQNGAPDPQDESVRDMVDFVARCDAQDPHHSWAGAAYDLSRRMQRRFNFGLLHQAIESRHGRTE